MVQSFKIGIVGVGMVGKEAADYFLSRGYQRGKNLFCFDADPAKNFSDDIKQADLIFVCVPTPQKKDGSCDSGIVESVVRKFAKSKKIFVIKSTIEPGTTERLQKKYKTKVFFSPEFLTEAKAKENFINPDRQIIGPTADRTADISLAEKILNILPKAPLVSPNIRVNPHSLKISASEAELGKYGANVFGAMKVVFGNILADFSAGLEKVLAGEKKAKINYDNIRKIVAGDKRIGDAWLDVYHGNYRGFGGYCFPKDLSAFIAFGKKLKRELAQNDSNRKLVAKGVAFLEAMRDYNIALLNSQNLDIKEVSSHDHTQAAKKLKNAKPKS